jgi:hypothetical protein
MSDLSSDITTNAQGPKKAKGDMGSMEQHDLDDQIAADRYLKAIENTGSNKVGFKRCRIKPGGTI